MGSFWREEPFLSSRSQEELSVLNCELFAGTFMFSSLFTAQFLGLVNT